MTDQNNDYLEEKGSEKFSKVISLLELLGLWTYLANTYLLKVNYENTRK